MSVPEIDVAQAQAAHAANEAAFYDIRQPSDHARARVPGSKPLGESEMNALLAGDKSAATIVYCYKGNGSKAAVEHLLGQGLTNVKSLTGGFEAWSAAKAPTESGNPNVSTNADGVAISESATAKLKEYLANESEGTAIRVTLEGNGRFGLALDEPQDGDARFKAGDLTVIAEAKLGDAVKGLTIDWVRTGMSYGFALEGGTPPPPPGKADLLEDVKKRIAENPIMIFMKGTADQPMCGFSARSVEVLRSLGKPFGDKNVLEIQDYRYVLSEHSNWPTIPQIFVGGEFLGGCDILMELNASGELQKKVDEVFAAQNA